MEDSELKQAVIVKLRQLVRSGKNILGPPFIGDNGNAILSASNFTETQYYVHYSYGSQMWNWAVDKTEIHL